MTPKSLRKTVVALVAAIVLGALLIWAPGSLAQFTSTAAGRPLVITTGTITASATGPTVGTVSAGAAPAGVVLNAAAVGIVPGVQDQTLTYAVTNNAASTSPASITTVQLVSTGVSPGASWTDIQPYLVVTVAINGGLPVAVPRSAITASGINASVPTSANLQPGTSATVVVQFDIPATAPGGSADLARTLQGDRAIGALITLAPVFTLTQTPKAAP